MTSLNPPPSVPENVVKTNPPPGKKKILDIYWDPDTQEYVLTHSVTQPSDHADIRPPYYEVAYIIKV